jgi:hypothetical protein
MANTNRNLLTYTYSGKVGNHVMKTRGDKSIIATRPKPPKKLATGDAQQSQAAVRLQFQRATLYAKTAMKNAALKEQYSAVRRNNQTAHNVAFQDAFKGPVLSDLRTDKYTGAAGQVILVQAMDNFRVSTVEFKLTSADGTLIEQGVAVQAENGFQWGYTTQVANPAIPGTTILVTATDVPNNETKLEKVL